MPVMSLLPDEVWLLVFASLCEQSLDTRWFWSVRCTCSHWRSLAKTPHFWKEVVFMLGRPPAGLAAALHNPARAEAPPSANWDQPLMDVSTNPANMVRLIDRELRELWDMGILHAAEHLGQTLVLALGTRVIAINYSPSHPFEAPTVAWVRSPQDIVVWDVSDVWSPAMLVGAKALYAAIFLDRQGCGPCWVAADPTTPWLAPVSRLASRVHANTLSVQQLKLGLISNWPSCHAEAWLAHERLNQEL